jgi:hypothetical protein
MGKKALGGAVIVAVAAAVIVIVIVIVIVTVTVYPNPLLCVLQEACVLQP